ncbi:MAG: hypothetical protein M1269_09975 [Chloroflexi bacterium]|nr:hypothetical protein [Chloroflexota bacterium]
MKEYLPYIHNRSRTRPAAFLEIIVGDDIPGEWREAEFLFGHSYCWDFFTGSKGCWLIYYNRDRRRPRLRKKDDFQRAKYHGKSFVYRYRIDAGPVPGMDILPAPEYVPPPIEEVDKVVFMSPDMKEIKLWMRELPKEFSSEDYFVDPLEQPLLDSILQVNLPRLEDSYLFHASAVDDGGKGYLFPGLSGNGKSTIARLWDGKARIIQEDTVKVGGRTGGARISSVPQAGALSEPGPSVRLAGVFALKQAKTHRVTRLSLLEAISVLFYNAMKPVWDGETCKLYVEYCVWLASHVPCFLLEFAPEPSVCSIVREEIKKTGREKPAVITPLMGEKKLGLKNFKGILGLEFE